VQVLVACEESQTVTKEFRRFGHDAYSCDILPCSGGHPAWHLQLDVKYALKSSWDMILAFPPCTHIAASGARSWIDKEYDGRQQQGIDFFMSFVNVSCPRVLIENPVGIMSRIWQKPTQIIHPWQFGHGETKATCLWLRGLPKLKPTNIVEGRENKVWHMAGGKQRSRLRSRTYDGIAKAMAQQYGTQNT